MKRINYGKSGAKTRSTPVIITLPQSYYQNISDGQRSYFGGGPYQTGTHDETISSGAQLRGKRYLSNPCRHLKTTTHIVYGGAISITGNTVADPSQTLTYSNYPVHSAGAHAAAVSASKAAFATSLQDSFLAANGQSLMNLNFDKMRPDLTEVSVPNFMIDFAQISSLWKLWNRARSFASNVAGANLNYQYGWKPTIGDVQAAVRSIRNLQEKMRNWERNLGKLISKRCTVYSKTSNESATQSYNGWGTLKWTATLEQKCTAHILYRPKPLKVMTLLERTLRGSLDSLGFELNPNILWDAIPFSFVIDWFIDIGAYCESHKIDTFELPIDLEDAYLQYHERYTCMSSLTEDATSTWPAMKYPGAASEEKYFSRAQIGPSTVTLRDLGWKMPSLNQIGLALSLGLTRRRF
jgi:hypothetical protein